MAHESDPRHRGDRSGDRPDGQSGTPAVEGLGDRDGEHRRGREPDGQGRRVDPGHQSDPVGEVQLDQGGEQHVGRRHAGQRQQREQQEERHRARLAAQPQPDHHSEEGDQGQAVQARQPRESRSKSADGREGQHRQRRQHARRRGRHPEPLLDVGEHRTDAHRRRTQVERQHDDADDDEDLAHGPTQPHGARERRWGLRGCAHAARLRPSNGVRGWPAVTPWRTGSARWRTPSTRWSASTPRRRPASTCPSQARADVAVADIDRALFDDRSVVKQLAMRRTVFAFPRGLLPAVWGSAAARVAGQLETRLAKEVEANGIAKNGGTWVTRTCNAVLRSLEEEGPATTAELRERVPTLARRIELAPGKAYGGSFPIANRLIGTLAASGRILRGENAGHWRLSRPRWTLTESWLGASAGARGA